LFIDSFGFWLISLFLELFLKLFHDLLNLGVFLHADFQVSFKFLKLHLMENKESIAHFSFIYCLLNLLVWLVKVVIRGCFLLIANGLIYLDFVISLEYSLHFVALNCLLIWRWRWGLSRWEFTLQSIIVLLLLSLVVLDFLYSFIVAVLIDFKLCQQPREQILLYFMIQIEKLFDAIDVFFLIFVQSCTPLNYNSLFLVLEALFFAFSLVLDKFQ